MTKILLAALILLMPASPVQAYKVRSAPVPARRYQPVSSERYTPVPTRRYRPAQPSRPTQAKPYRSRLDAPRFRVR